MDDDKLELIKTREAAARVDLAPETLRRFVSEGRLPAVRLPGGHLRFNPDDLASITERRAK